MVVLIAILLLELVAVSVTALYCWSVSRRRGRVTWHIAFVGAAAASLLFVVITDSGFLFHPDRWGHAKTSLIIELRSFLLWFGITITPTLLVVRQYRSKVIGDEKPVA